MEKQQHWILFHIWATELNGGNPNPDSWGMMTSDNLWVPFENRIIFVWDMKPPFMHYSQKEVLNSWHTPLIVPWWLSPISPAQRVWGFSALWLSENVSDLRKISQWITPRRHSTSSPKMTGLAQRQADFNHVRTKDSEEYVKHTAPLFLCHSHDKYCWRWGQHWTVQYNPEIITSNMRSS